MFTRESRPALEGYPYLSPSQFEQLIQSHRTSLQARAFQLTRNRADAEDLVQETLLRAYGNIDSVTNTATLKAWLHTIQLNLFRTQYRRSHRFPTQTLEDNALLMVPASVNSVESEIFLKMRREAVLSALARLPELYQEALLLADTQGKSYQEVADYLNIPIGTVRSRINRGRQQLRRMLKSWMTTDGRNPYSCGA